MLKTLILLCAVLFGCSQEKATPTTHPDGGADSLVPAAGTDAGPEPAPNLSAQASLHPAVKLLSQFDGLVARTTDGLVTFPSDPGLQPGDVFWVDASVYKVVAQQPGTFAVQTTEPDLAEAFSTLEFNGTFKGKGYLESADEVNAPIQQRRIGDWDVELNEEESRINNEGTTSTRYEGTVKDTVTGLKADLSTEISTEWDLAKLDLVRNSGTGRIRLSLSPEIAIGIAIKEHDDPEIEGACTSQSPRSMHKGRARLNTIYVPVRVVVIVGFVPVPLLFKLRIPLCVALRAKASFEATLFKLKGDFVYDMQLKGSQTPTVSGSKIGLSAEAPPSDSAIKKVVSTVNQSQVGVEAKASIDARLEASVEVGILNLTRIGMAFALGSEIIAEAEVFAAGIGKPFTQWGKDTAYGCVKVESAITARLGGYVGSNWGAATRTWAYYLPTFENPLISNAYGLCPKNEHLGRLDIYAGGIRRAALNVPEGWSELAVAHSSAKGVATLDAATNRITYTAGTTAGLDEVSIVAKQAGKTVSGTFEVEIMKNCSSSVSESSSIVSENHTCLYDRTLEMVEEVSKGANIGSGDYSVIVEVHRQYNVIDDARSGRLILEEFAKRENYNAKNFRLDKHSIWWLPITAADQAPQKVFPSAQGVVEYGDRHGPTALTAGIQTSRSYTDSSSIDCRVDVKFVSDGLESTTIYNSQRSPDFCAATAAQVEAINDLQAAR